MKKGSKQLLIMGIGNLIMGDEGVGVQVVQRLEKEAFPENVKCLDGGTGGFFLLDEMQQAERIIIIDAAAFDDAPGSIRKLTPKYSKDYPKTLTAHDTGLKDLLDSFYLLEARADIRLIAITINPRFDFSMELTEEIAQAAEKAMKLVKEEVNIFLCEMAGVA